MGVFRKLGATTTAVAVMGAGLMAAALPANSTAPANVTAAVAPATVTAVSTAATAPAAAAATTAATSILPGKLRLDRSCLKGRVICINKVSRKIAFLYNGKLLATADVRFGCSSTPTRTGNFKLYWKSKNHVSSIYKTAMPYSMFFSGGQAIHYSADFRARGYNGCSHGCVNMRDLTRIAWIYNRVLVGDRIFIYSA